MTTLIVTIGCLGAFFIAVGIGIDMAGDGGGLVQSVGVVILLVDLFILAAIGGLALWAA